MTSITPALNEADAAVAPSRSSSTVGGWEYDLLHNAAHWTPGVYRLHGLSPDEPLTDWDAALQRTLACLEPSDRPLLEASLERCLSEGQACDLELPFTSPSGHRLWLRITAQPVWDAQSSRIVKIVGSLTDITPRKEAEAALKQRMEALERSERHFRTLVEQVPAMIHLSALDAPGSTLYISPRVETMLGYTPAEWIANPQLFWQRVHPDDVERIRAQHEHQRLTGQPLQRELRLIARDGRVVWLSEESTVIFDAQGNPQATQGAAFDVTERRRAEDELRLAHAIAETSHTHTTLSDLLAAIAGCIRGATGWQAVAIRLEDERGEMLYRVQVGFPSALDRLACPLPEGEGCLCWAVIAGRTEGLPGQVTATGSWYTDRLDDRCGVTPESGATCAGALCRWLGFVSVALVPLRLNDRTIGFIHLADRRVRVAPGEDVRLVEAVAGHICAAIQRVQAEVSLHAALAEKEALLREVHHRVKNNFASVIGLVDLQRDTLDDERSAAMLTDLSARIRSMAIVHELLYQSETLREIELQEYLHILIARLPVIFTGRVSVHFRVEAADVRMNLDTAVPTGLIVNELVTNALKYAFPEGRPRPGANRCEIAITATWDGAAYTLTVADNGVGLPAGLDWAAGRTLGLRLVRMLALHQLHGQVEVDRSNGTTFRLRFPPPARRR